MYEMKDAVDGIDFCLDLDEEGLCKLEGRAK